MFVLIWKSCQLMQGSDKKWPKVDEKVTKDLSKMDENESKSQPTVDQKPQNDQKSERLQKADYQNKQIRLTTPPCGQLSYNRC